MACIKRASRSALVSFAPDSPYLAAGTRAGAVDSSFSSSANLEIFNLDFQSNDPDLPVIGDCPSSEPFNRLSWSKAASAAAEEYSLGLVAGCLVDGSISVWNPLKLIRQAMRCPHISGRKGQARVADELWRKNPDKEIMRTDVWHETHTKKDGSASCEEMERVRVIHENNPLFAQGHLDQVRVVRICGRDTRGHVKGMGSGISKYAISRSAPYKRALEQEKKSNVTLHTEVEQLKEHVREMQQILASRGEGQMRFSSNHESSSQVRQDSSCQEAQSDQATTNQSSSPLLKLLHLTKNTCVAYGRQSNESTEESSWKRIILDEIVDGNVDLINGQGKMEDLTPGDAIDWPEFRIISI